MIYPLILRCFLVLKLVFYANNAGLFGSPCSLLHFAVWCVLKKIYFSCVNIFGRFLVYVQIQIHLRSFIDIPTKSYKIKFNFKQFGLDLCLQLMKVQALQKLSLEGGVPGIAFPKRFQKSSFRFWALPPPQSRNCNKEWWKKALSREWDLGLAWPQSLNPSINTFRGGGYSDLYD